MWPVILYKNQGNQDTIMQIPLAWNLRLRLNSISVLRSYVPLVYSKKYYTKMCQILIS